MPKGFPDYPFVSSSAPVKITKDARDVGPNHVESWVITDRINVERNLRDKWIVRHANRLGLAGPCNELVERYGKAGQRTLDLFHQKHGGARAGGTRQAAPATARAATARPPISRVSTTRPATAGRSGPEGATGGRDLGEENRALRRENQELKLKLDRVQRKSSSSLEVGDRTSRRRPVDLKAMYPEQYGHWTKKKREPRSHPAGTIADPCNLPATRKQVSKQRHAMGRLSQPKEYQGPKVSAKTGSGSQTARM